MNFRLRKSLLAVTVTGLLATPLAHATNGYFMHGYSTKNKGLAGAGAAFSQDAMAAAVNPAGMAFVEKRIDLGLQIWSVNDWVRRKLFDAITSRVEFHAVVESEARDPLGRRAPIPHRVAADSDARSRSKIARSNAGAHHVARGRSFKTPGRHRAVFVLHVDDEPGMRIGILEFTDDAFERDRRVERVHAIRMVRKRGQRQKSDDRSGQNTDCESHCHYLIRHLLR